MLIRILLAYISFVTLHQVGRRQIHETNLIFQALGLSGWERTTPPLLPHPNDDQGGHHHQVGFDDHQDDQGDHHQDPPCIYFLHSFAPSWQMASDG